MVLKCTGCQFVLKHDSKCQIKLINSMYSEILATDRLFLASKSPRQRILTEREFVPSLALPANHQIHVWTHGRVSLVTLS